MRCFKMDQQQIELVVFDWAGIPHGAAVAMLLAPVLELNAPAIPGVDRLLEALGVRNAADLKARVDGLLKRSGQPSALKDWGVQPDDLPRLAALGMTRGRAGNNPVALDAETIRELQDHHGPAALDDPEAEHRLHRQPPPAGCCAAVLHADHRPEQGRDRLRRPAAVAVLSLASLLYLGIDWGKMASRIPDIGVVFWDLAHLDFSNMDLILSSLVETVSIAVLSLLYSLVLGVLFGMLAARNVFRIPVLSVVTQAFFTFLRAVPTPVWVLLMLVCLGMGPEAGVAILLVFLIAYAIERLFVAIKKKFNS